MQWATLPVFALAAGCSPWEAVNYCDGDGGSIVVEQFPGLSTYLRQQNVTTPSLVAPWCTLVQFREAFHNAMELGHLYTVVTQEDDEPGPSTRHASTFCDGTMAIRLLSMLVAHCLTEPTEDSLPAIAPPPGYLMTTYWPASTILEQVQCPICLRILHQPMELPCRALCMVEWFKVFSCSEVKCPCCFTDTPLTAAPQLIQTLLTDMVLECQTCRKDIRGVEYITHQCSGEPTKAEVQTASGVLRSTSVLRRNYCYQALVHARRTLATAKVILLVCHGVLKGRERRSGCCGDCHSRRDIRLISCAVWALVSFRPCSTAEAFLSGQSAVALPGSSCLITNSPQFLNESHLCVHQSFIAGAGQFLKKKENEIEGRLTKIEKPL
eukprot:Em0014g81a